MLHFALSTIFVGLWTEIFHWGLGIGLIILFGLAAYFSPIAKPLFVACAVAVAAFLGGYTVGTHDADVKCTARAAAVDKAVANVVKKTTTKKARAKVDPYDQRTY